MTDEQTGPKEAKAFLRSVMIRKNISYDDLVERLRAVGINDNVANLRNKIARGRFTAFFLIQCLEVMECSLWVQNIQPISQRKTAS